jgi:hypothetical protein
MQKKFIDYEHENGVDARPSSMRPASTCR